MHTLKAIWPKPKSSITNVSTNPEKSITGFFVTEKCSRRSKYTYFV